MATTATLTPARRGVAAALLFLASAVLAGVTPRPTGVEYRTFGMVDGVLALLLVYLLLLRRVWLRPPGALGWLAVGYGTVATAQLLALLLPPPGVVQWVVVTTLAFSAWAALAGRSRTRLVASLASLALLLALLKFSVIPFLWVRAGPAAGQGWGLGDLAEGFRRLFVEYHPLGPGAELLGFAALGCWALATRLLWSGPGALPAPRRRSDELDDAAEPW